MRRRIFWSLSNRRALNEVDVEITVVVVVEERNAWSEDLRVVERSGRAVHVHEVEAGLTGDLDEPIGSLRLAIGGRARPRRWRAAATGQQHTDEKYKPAEQ